MVNSVQGPEDKDMDPLPEPSTAQPSTSTVWPAATTIAIPIVNQAVAMTGESSSGTNVRQPDAPGRTGRGPAVTATSATPLEQPREYTTTRVRLPFRDPRHEDYFRAGEAEREAQRVVGLQQAMPLFATETEDVLQMIAAQRETIRAGDGVIDALRQQVRQLQQRLDHTTSINNTLRMQQHELLTAEEAVVEQYANASITTEATLRGSMVMRQAANNPFRHEPAHVGYTGSAQASTSSTSSLARHLGVGQSPSSSSTTRTEDVQRARERRNELVQEAMAARRLLVNERTRQNWASTPTSEEDAAILRQRRAEVVARNAERRAAGYTFHTLPDPRAAAEDEASDAESDIFADMPPLEALDDTPPTSPRPAAAELPTRPADFATSIAPWRPHDPPTSNASRESQTEALERLRRDPHFRTRVQQYMQPETAARILEVLDSGNGTRAQVGPDRTYAAAAAAATAMGGGPSASNGRTPISEAWDEDKAYWSRAKGHVDADGDRVGPANASKTLEETRRNRRMAKIDVGR